MFDGVTVNPADVVVMYTYAGDTNLDGLLDARDFNAVLNGLSNALPGWSNGDIDLDGAVTATDWTRFLAAYQYYLGNPLPFGAPTDGAGGAIPEPSALIVIGLAPLLAARRPRRRTGILRHAGTP
jgi:hypothetical protein